MSYRRWTWLLVVVCGVPLLVGGCDRFRMICWVGSTDLEVEFDGTDAATGGPIPSVRVEVQSEGGFYEEDYKQEFVIVADTGGSAQLRME